MKEIETNVFEWKEELADEDFSHFSVCVGERYVGSCSYNTDELSVGKITVLLTDTSNPFHIYVVPPEKPGTYAAWMHSPGETVMTRMFSVQQSNDREIAENVIFRFLQDLVQLYEREDASRE